ncbi:MAG: MGMT family protein [Clostridia bacterium]|nr:MGMT family protein [Clostridia bacterium]
MKNFYERVYKLVKIIPKGKVTTYGEIAKALGSIKYSRAVGYALHANPYFGIVPCHRVVNKKGLLAANFVFGTAEVQKKLLENEGVAVNSDYAVDLKKYLFTF